MIHSRVRTSFQHRWFIPELELHFSKSIWRPSRADHLREPSFQNFPTNWLPKPFPYLLNHHTFIIIYLQHSFSYCSVLISDHTAVPFHNPFLTYLSVSFIIDTSVPSFPNRFLPFFLSSNSHPFYRFGQSPHLYVPFLGHLIPLFSNPSMPFWTSFYRPFRPLNSVIHFLALLFSLCFGLCTRAHLTCHEASGDRSAHISVRIHASIPGDDISL